MWHYILYGANESVRQHGADSGVCYFVGEALRGAGLTELKVRELYFYSVAQADQGLYDGAGVDLEFAIAMILAGAADDKSLPSCKFEGPAGQYVNIG
ncbi:hypothetical protein AB4212_58625, partial [Streptomyces sp. 2MCAF27]